MKKTIYNIIIATLIVALMFIISLTAIASGFTPEPIDQPKVTTTSSEYLSVWKQAVNTEYAKHGIYYRGESNVQ